MPHRFQGWLRLWAVGAPIGLVLFSQSLGAATVPVSGKPVPMEAIQSLESGSPQDLIVVFDDAAIEVEARQLRRSQGTWDDTFEVATLRKTRYQSLRDGVRSALPAGEVDALEEYSHLPISYLRINSRSALDHLLSDTRVRGVALNGLKHPVLDSQSQSLVRQPITAAQGLTGAGTAAVIVDTGANYTVADLGSCSAPGSAGCHLALARAVNSAGKVVADSVSPTSAYNDHGTNVASIVAGVAPGTRIIQMNVFGTGASTSDVQILAAMNWAYANQATYNIRAVNLSLGDSTLNTGPCSADLAYVTAVNNLRSAGIIPVIAAGNDAYTNGIAAPACTPNAVSVGAVYAGNFGGLAWSNCTDYTTTADQVTCFSNSASFLTLLAPGALITAGGLEFGGTSQATPFVTGASAVLRAAYPAESIDQTVARMTGNGKPITDARNGVTKARLDLFAAAGLGTTLNSSGEVPLPGWSLGLLALALFAAGRYPCRKRMI